MMTYRLGEMSKTEIRSVLNREDLDLAAAMAVARPIVEDVKTRGDASLRAYARKLDGFKGGPLTISRSEIRQSGRKVPEDITRALLESKRRIEAFHSRQKLCEFEYNDSCGLMGQKVVPLRRVGVYVPGGSADYVSSVLMACIPARLAGVREIAICTPGRNSTVPSAILAAADMCEVSEVHPVGGAQAIAAMAYGTESVPKVQKIVGPGGSIVAAAKMLVRNDCEIDFLAGPSEVLVVADDCGDPELIASDMLAQLEHDPLARAVLVTTSLSVLTNTKKALSRQMRRAGRRKIAAKAAEKGALFILTKDIEEALDFANAYAPEHLLLDADGSLDMLDRVENAGSVFLSRYSSVAFGDYCSGTNHILPTKGVASMKSSLSVYDFLKIIPYQRISPEGAVRLSATVDVLARTEGLPAHAEAALRRARKVKK